MGRNMPLKGGNMSRKQNYSRFSMRKQKSYLTVGVVALAAVIAMAGIYYKKTVDRKAEEQEAVIMAESEWTEDTEEMDETDSEDTGAAETSADSDGTEGETRSEDTGAETSGETAEDQQSTVSIVGNTDSTTEAAAHETAEALQFSEADSLDWPVSGDVILNYSMDQTVYFATLDQYKYNPALVIQSDVNTKVMAAADGQVLSVETTPETGQTISVDIGGGYQLIYGQLKDIQFSPGDRISRGELVGFISEPTKYYSVEGSNLYFQMLKDGEPANPMNYMQ